MSLDHPYSVSPMPSWPLPLLSTVCTVPWPTVHGSAKELVHCLPGLSRLQLGVQLVLDKCQVCQRWEGTARVSQVTAHAAYQIDVFIMGNY